MNKLALYLKRVLPTVLTIAASGGIIVTAVLAAKAAPEAVRMLDEAEQEKGRKLTKTEIIATAAPVYIPAVVSGVSSIVCVAGANILNKHQQTALAGAYALARNSFREYRNKVKDIYGGEAHRKVMDSLSVEKCADRNIVAPCLVTNASLAFDDGMEETRIFRDEFSGRHFESTFSKVLQAEYHLNRNYALNGDVSLNEFYDFLGLKGVDDGDSIGWSIDNEIVWIEFDHRKTVLEDGTACYVISMPFEPDKFPYG